MIDQDEDEGRATDRIVELETGETVGLVYVWEDGCKQPLWFNGVKSDVVLVGLSKQCCGSEKTRL